MQFLEYLSRDNLGNIQANLVNAYEIIMRDPKLKGRIFENTKERQIKQHKGKRCQKQKVIRSICGVAPLPWGSRQSAEGVFAWDDHDDTGLRLYLEKVYNIAFPKGIVFDTIDFIAAENPKPTE